MVSLPFQGKEYQTMGQSGQHAVVICSTYYEIWELTLNGNVAKIHDPMKDLSPDHAAANWHWVHSESALSGFALRALAAFVWDHAYVSFIWMHQILTNCLVKP